VLTPDEILGSTATVLAVAHQRRRPGYWHMRQGQRQAPSSDVQRRGAGDKRGLYSAGRLPRRAGRNPNKRIRSWFRTIYAYS